MTNAELIKRARYRAQGPLQDAEFSEGLLNECADALEADEAKRIDLEAKLANAERRAEDAETRNDFLLSEIDEIIKRERQKS